MQKHYIFIAALVIVVGAASFFGGMKYGQSKTTADRQGRFMQFAGNLQGAQGGARFLNGERNAANGSAFVAGKILQVGNNSITLQAGDGSSKVVLYSDSTQVSKETTGSQSDLAAGAIITIQGDANADGSITAKMIQVR